VLGTHRAKFGLRVLRRSASGKLGPDASDGQRSANAPSQGRQDVLGTAVLASREPLAQLADEDVFLEEVVRGQ